MTVEPQSPNKVKMNWIERLKYKWNIQNNLDFILVLLVFSCAGMGVSFMRKKIFILFGLDHSSLTLKIIVSLVLIVPLYQLSTLFFGFFLGQFHFFWNRQKSIYRSLGKFGKRIFN